LPSGNGVLPVQINDNSSKADASQATNGVHSSQGTNKKASNAVKNQQKEELDIPDSPSPDYSNSPSPTPTGENHWEERVSANGKMYNRNGPTKFGFPPTANALQRQQQQQKEIMHGNKFHTSSSKEHPHKNNMSKRDSMSNNKDSEITTSGNGKVTIIVGDPNHIYNVGSINTPSSHSSRGVKANGGILKMANGNCNVNDHSQHTH
ncbi:unnamed protein product, partial [Allacma fusca]